MADVFEMLRDEILRIDMTSRLGRIAEVRSDAVIVTGISSAAAVGDRVLFMAAPTPVEGEVIAIRPESVSVLIGGMLGLLGIGMPARLLGPASLAPDDSWIGRVVDPAGAPLDGRPLCAGRARRPLRAGAPPAASRRRLGGRLATGVAVFDTCLPLVRGQRLGLFAGSGVGKSSLLAMFARGVEADVVVIGLVGERGRELREFTESVLGPAGMARSILIAATSDQPPMTRRRAAWSAMAVAEHFRDKGLHVLLLLDSVTRFAEAHREIALSSGETAALGGYPPSTAHLLMELAERAGPGPEGKGDITAIFTVLVPGSDMEEPVADILRGVLDGHVVMDRKIAERGRYPAIDLLRSVSRSLPQAATPEENALIAEVRQVMGTWDRAELMVQSGLYARGSDPMIDNAIEVWPSLDGFLAEPSPAGIKDSFERLSQCLKRAESRAGLAMTR
jgi:flagellum-specific ATP synthase